MTEAEILQQLTISVTDRVSTVVKESLSEIVQFEISKALSKALNEGEFYRSLNSQVIVGIGDIYSEISSVKKNLSSESSAEGYLHLLGQSDGILDDIVGATERATLLILENLEHMQDHIRDVREAVGKGDADSAVDTLSNMEDLILNTMTELSFQDLTGQQIRRVIQSLKKVEDIVFDLYVTSEVINKSKEQSPDKAISDIRKEVGALIDNAKNNKNKLEDQGGVDSLLDQLGM